MHALSAIRTHDPGFRASEDSACLRPLGYRDRQYNHTRNIIIFSGELQFSCIFFILFCFVLHTVQELSTVLLYIQTSNEIQLTA
jgi:hypothetical protein